MTPPREPDTEQSQSSCGEQITREERIGLVLAAWGTNPTPTTRDMAAKAVDTLARSGETTATLAEARRLLAATYTPEGVCVWLSGRKRSFNNERPVTLIARGDGERVLPRIQQLMDGPAT